jgi:hypothetical protein
MKLSLTKSKTTPATLSQLLSMPCLRTRYATTIGRSSHSNCPCLKGAKWGTDNNADKDDIDHPADRSRISKALDEDLLNAPSGEEDFDTDKNLAPSSVLNFPFV